MSKTTSPKVAVKKDPENLVPYEVLEQAIVDIGKGMKALQKSRLKQETVVTLVADQTKIAKGTIRHVLGALHDLEYMCLKPVNK